MGGSKRGVKGSELIDTVVIDTVTPWWTAHMAKESLSRYALARPLAVPPGVLRAASLRKQSFLRRIRGVCSRIPHPRPFRRDSHGQISTHVYILHIIPFLETTGSDTIATVNYHSSFRLPWCQSPRTINPLATPRCKPATDLSIFSSTLLHALRVLHG